MIREAVFAKQGWYPDSEDLARDQLDRYLDTNKTPSAAKAVVAPHAGWSFSGPTAGKLYAEVVVPDRVVIICPTHRAMGARVAVWPKGAWETPLGDIPVDEDFADDLIESSRLAREDYESHLLEHAIEIHLPFLKMRNPGLKIVPVRLGHLGVAAASTLAMELAELIQRSEGDTLIVASSDMSHESDYDLVRSNDKIAIARIEEMDGGGLIESVEDHRITMCGYQPVAVAIEAAKKLGARKATTIEYTTSADVSGRRDYVVGYLSARID